MAEEFALTSPSQDIGSLIEQLVNLRTQKAMHEKETERLGKEMAAVEETIIHELHNQRLERAAHGGYTVTPKTHTYAHVEDWSAFGDFILENRYLHLLEKRVSVTGYRELLELGREVPGVVPFPKTKLSVTKTTR